MNNLKIFENKEFGQVRTLTINDKPYFVASDIAKALGYSNPYDAVSRHCKGIVKHEVLTNGGNQKVNFIPECDMYRLITNSELPSAEKFETWVFDEVLPSIIQTGMYATDELLNNPDLLIAAATKLKEERAARLQAEQKVLELKPKADFFDAVANSKTAVSLGDVAKVLGIKGLGRNNLFELLRTKGVLNKDNIPYQRFIDNGYFRVIEQKYTKGGETHINFKTLVYQRGVDYIRKMVTEA